MDRPASHQWFREARLGLFIHWGLYSLLGRGEWVMVRDGIPAGEYNRLALSFNPAAFSADRWCQAAVDAGMKYAVFTTRHHDGFAMFDSRADSFNSLHSPARRDFVAEFVRSCRKYGLGVGLYYSLNDWRFSRSGRPPEDYGPEMRELAHAQLKELMTHYGKIDILWYDGSACPGKNPRTADDVAEFWQSEKLNRMVRGLQPGILINNRSGMKQDFHDIEGKNIIRTPPENDLWEACFTLGDDDFSYWGYCRSANFRRTPAQTLLLLLHVLEQGGNCLLNVSPDQDGLIPHWQQEILNAVGDWVGKHSEAVYKTEKTEAALPTPNSLQGNSCGFFTASGNTLFFYLYEWPGKITQIPCLRKKIRSVAFLKTGLKIDFEQRPDGFLLLKGLPEHQPDLFCTVLRMETDGDI